MSKWGIHYVSPPDFKGGSRGKHLGAKGDRAGDLGIWHAEGDRERERKEWIIVYDRWRRRRGMSASD